MEEDQSAKLATAPARRWGIAWVILVLALAVHVADEALNDFLSFYNPLVERTDFPFPTFTFGTWMTGLIVAVAVLLSLSPLVFRGVRRMLPLSFFLGGLMVVNGLGHLFASILTGGIVPGSYSSPVLLVAACFLLFATLRFSRYRG